MIDTQPIDKNYIRTTSIAPSISESDQLAFNSLESAMKKKISYSYRNSKIKIKFLI